MEFAMNRKSYPSDLSDKKWSKIEPIFYENVYRKAGLKGKEKCLMPFYMF
jgi:hypothetical protein